MIIYDVTIQQGNASCVAATACAFLFRAFLGVVRARLALDQRCRVQGTYPQRPYFLQNRKIFLATLCLLQVLEVGGGHAETRKRMVL